MTNVKACYGALPTEERPPNDKYAFLYVFHTWDLHPTLTETYIVPIYHKSSQEIDHLGHLVQFKYHTNILWIILS